MSLDEPTREAVHALMREGYGYQDIPNLLARQCLRCSEAEVRAEAEAMGADALAALYRVSDPAPVTVTAATFLDHLAEQTQAWAARRAQDVSLLRQWSGELAHAGLVWGTRKCPHCGGAVRVRVGSSRSPATARCATLRCLRIAE